MATDFSRTASRVATAAAKAAAAAAAKAAEAATTESAKTAAKAGQLARKADQAARAAGTLDRLAAHLDALDLWTRAEPGSRKPRHSRDDIAAAAVRVADAEGFDALSMRRLAAELGAGTMTLYHYVHTKHELLTLVADAVMGEVLLPEGTSPRTDWREAMVDIAVRTRDMIRRHPWLLDIIDDPGIGPNSMRHFDQTLAAAAGYSDDLADQLDLVLAVDEHVFGHCLHQRMNFTDVASSAEHDRAMQRYVREMVATGDYPNIARHVERLGFDATWRVVHTHGNDDTRFERSVRRMLDGFDARRTRRP
jgi:AcrR family transcriptional regulator